MKPIQLKMTAFGPYKFTETIDFTELKDNRLFVISGATGAGKTTIFDGISFALYGSGSGEDRRDTKMMRSDFATDETHTAVELIFEIHNRRYRILRQLSHVKKGNKGATGERYEFFEVKETGEVPVVERQIVSEINKKVEEIIGLTQDQFSQIVMLPQGEFRKLLTSQTENKEAILRKIFKTEPYKMISERLRDKKQIAEAELKKEETTRHSYTEQVIASFPRRDSNLFQLIESDNYNTFQLVEALKEETSFYKEKTQLDELAYNEVHRTHASKLGAYHEAKTINERFRELDIKEQRLNNLKDQSEEYAGKQHRLVEAERASAIETVENYYVELQQEASNKSKLLEIAKATVSEAEESTRQVEVSYTMEANKKEAREKSVEALIQLNALLPLFEELETKRNDMLEHEKHTEELNKQVTSKTKLFIEEKAFCSSQKEEIDTLEALVEPLDNEVQQLAILQAQHNLMQQFSANERLLHSLKIEEALQEKLFLEMQEIYQLKESNWMSNQASILASKLIAGEACPVCGSTEHKEISANMHNQTINEDEIQRVKKQLSQQESSLLTIRAKKETAQEAFEKMQAQLEEFHVTALEANQLKEDVEKLEEEVTKLRLEKERLAILREPYKANLLKMDKLEQEKNSLETSYQQHKSLFEQVKAVYQSKKSSIPAHIASLQELNDQLIEAKKYKEQLENAWDEAQKRQKLVSEALTRAKLSLEHATTASQEASEKREKAHAQFVGALTKAGFDTMELYTAAKMSETDRSALKELYNAYKQALHTLTEQVTEAQEQLKDNVKVELTPLEDELSQLKIAYEVALNVLNSSKEYAKVGLELEEKIVSASTRISMLEQQLSRIIDLYDMLRGQNQLKISFERFIQMEYLEQIIHAANERLKHLSNGQYYLVRSERQETHGKQSGLGLDVYDAYTGQMRDVKTLSGGEKFNASLCLALGMADVIQSFQGSIRIETMFIDEGFGSLDEESLNKAIDTLIDLQKSGRMIGVISHVAELKAAIPAILEVDKLKEGYSKTKFVIK